MRTLVYVNSWMGPVITTVALNASKEHECQKFQSKTHTAELSNSFDIEYSLRSGDNESPNLANYE